MSRETSPRDLHDETHRVRMDRRLDGGRTSVLPTLISRFNVLPSPIPAKDFVDTEKLILQFTSTAVGPGIAKAISKSRQAEGIALPGLSHGEHRGQRERDTQVSDTGEDPRQPHTARPAPGLRGKEHRCHTRDGRVSGDRPDTQNREPQLESQAFHTKRTQMGHGFNYKTTEFLERKLSGRQGCTKSSWVWSRKPCP